jgi:adenylate cyclase
LLAGLRKAGVPEGAGTDLKYADFKHLISNNGGEYYVAGAIKIDAAKANVLHAQSATFVDVRAAIYFRRGHIPNAVNLDLIVGLSQESLSQVAQKEGAVVFMCHAKYCPYSAYASAKALLWGYKRVYYFAGGFPAWKNAGYPVETSSEAIRSN